MCSLLAASGAPPPFAVFASPLHHVFSSTTLLVWHTVVSTRHKRTAPWPRPSSEDFVELLERQLVQFSKACAAHIDRHGLVMKTAESSTTHTSHWAQKRTLAAIAPTSSGCEAPRTSAMLLPSWVGKSQHLHLMRLTGHLVQS